MATITIVNSGICNLGSISRSIERAGGAVRIATEPAQVASADRLILPGVGSFPAGMKALNERGLAGAIRDFAAAERPLLGICLGMQLLFDTGEEFEETPGLGLIPGRVREIDSKGYAVPHMGWNRTETRREDMLMTGLPDEAYFYFVHSFMCEPDDDGDIVATTEYGKRFCSIVGRGNIRGFQAHPEKSQRCGARVLENFLKL